MASAASAERALIALTKMIQSAADPAITGGRASARLFLIVENHDPTPRRRLPRHAPCYPLLPQAPSLFHSLFHPCVSGTENDHQAIGTARQFTSRKPSERGKKNNIRENRG
jgi:hypothetical protein